MRELCGPNIPVLLVGCKRDLRDEAMRNGAGESGRFVTTEQVRRGPFLHLESLALLQRQRD